MEPPRAEMDTERILTSLLFQPPTEGDRFESTIKLIIVADPGCLSRIRLFLPGSSKNLSIFNPKKAKKWFLSSKQYDPGYSSRIPDPDADFLPSRIPKKAPNPGSATLKLMFPREYN
jgi:hypothetical protein